MARGGGLRRHPACTAAGMDRCRRLPENACGRFSVTEDCIGCGLCAAYAPGNLDWNAAGTKCFVARQPRCVLETEAVWGAIMDCPVAALRDDGAAS